MTDEQQEPQLADAAAAVAADDTGATVVGAIGDETGTQAAGAVVTDYDYAVAVAAFADDSAAMSAYQALQDAETAGQLSIDGVLVIKTDADGKVIGRVKGIWVLDKEGDQVHRRQVRNHLVDGVP